MSAFLEEQEKDGSEEKKREQRSRQTHKSKSQPVFHLKVTHKIPSDLKSEEPAPQAVRRTSPKAKPVLLTDNNSN